MDGLPRSIFLSPSLVLTSEVRAFFAAENHRHKEYNVNWLLWREFRLNRWILVTSATVILLCYAIALFVDGFIATEDNPDPDEHAFAGFGVAFSALTVALLAGNAFAGELADRSVEFLDYLPLERTHLLASKLLLCFSTITVLCMSDLLVLAQTATNRQVGFRELVSISSIAVLVFGVSWLVSSFQSSPALATVSGLMAAIAFVGGVAAESLTSVERGALLAVVFAIGIGCFSIGTWHYLRGPKL
jgi:ABC-type transport system involved in multi-copper enzyme maturation permease subunit